MSWRSKKRYKRRGQARENPYFRRKSGGLTPRRLVLVLAPLILVALASYLIWGPLMRIRSIEYGALSEELAPQVSTIVDVYLGSNALLIIPRNQYWIFSAPALEKKLVEALPLNSVTFERKGARLTLHVDEKVRTFYLMKNDTLYDIDRSGSVIGVIDDLERIRLLTDSTITAPIIYDERSYVINEQATIFDPSFLENVVALYDLIEQHTLLTPTAVTVREEQGRVDISTQTGVEIYMTFDRDLQLQVEKLVTLIERDLVDLNDLTYIDVRFTNRLYYQ